MMHLRPGKMQMFPEVIRPGEDDATGLKDGDSEGGYARMDITPL